MNNPITCYYALGAINYKNGFVTSCPQQSDQLYIMKEGQSIKPSDIINSEGFKKHRKEMMSGEWSPGCHLCKEIEKNGAGHSMRKDYPVATSHYNEETGSIELSGVKHLELRFSNACNFACLHCSDVYSSGWMSKLKYYEPDKDDYRYQLVQLTKQMHRVGANDKLSIDIDLESMEVIVNDLIANFPNLEKIDFAGGEVLYQKQFLPCLELLATHPNAKNIGIVFHSNFNAKADLKRLYNALKNFKCTPNIPKSITTTIMLSLDSGKNIYDYFRTGHWEVLKQNLSEFNSYDVDNDIKLIVVCTTSAYQIMDIENVFESFLELDVNEISSSIVYTPKYLNPSLMMLKFKDEVLADLEATKITIREINVNRYKNIAENVKRRSWHPVAKTFIDIKSAQHAIENIKTYITNTVQPNDEYLFESLEHYIGKTDKIWKQEFNERFVKYKYIDGKIIRNEHD